MNKQFEGRVSAVTRRYIQVLTKGFQTVEGKIASRDLDTVVGDFVRFRYESLEDSPIEVTTVLDRVNLLQRSLGKRTKKLAANIDHLFIVSAPAELFNTVAVDRVLAAAFEQSIPSRILLNKSDLTSALAQSQEIIDGYRKIGIAVQEISAKSGLGCEALLEELTDSAHECVVLTGISGVGKSSILHRLIPGLDVRIQEVSERTGQGRQTTSHALGHVLQRKDKSPLMIVDLPGVQNFGLCHLDAETVRGAFTEFHNLSSKCRFNNCSHIKEPACAVCRALELGEIMKSRYASYQDILEELRTEKIPY